MSTWTVTVNQYGEKDTEEVEAETLGKAVDKGLKELGWADNDEGHIQIEVQLS